MDPYWSDGELVTLYLGKCEQILPELPAGSVDAVVTDPPAAIAFMGRAWDSDLGGRDRWVAWLAGVMGAASRVLKPGGHLLVWSLPRTSHWTALALEDAGLEIRDCVMHLFGSGFPKSLDVSKAIDKTRRRDYVAAALRLGMEIPGRNLDDWTKEDHSPGDRWWAEFKQHLSAEQWGAIEREVVSSGKSGAAAVAYVRDVAGEYDVTAPATEEAKRWAGFGTSLKPGQEMWWLARKPLGGRTVAASVLEFGTGALNIDACKVGTTRDVPASLSKDKTPNGVFGEYGGGDPKELDPNTGRWPANIVLTHSHRDWYALRRDIPEDIRQTILAYYRSAEGVREVRDGLLRDALRASTTPVLFSGLRECGPPGSPGDAVGADGMPAVRDDVRDVSGVGAQRAAQVLHGGVPRPGAGGDPEPEPDREAAHRRLAGQDGHEPGDPGAVLPVEGRPVSGQGLLVRAGGPAARRDAAACTADDEGPLCAGTPGGRGADGRASAEPGRCGAPHQRGEAGQPAGEPDRDAAGEPLAGAPRDREAVRDADGRGGDAPRGERILAVPDGLIPPGWLNHFTYLDSAACNGACAADCPVAELDRQSGVSTSTGGSRGAGGQHGAFSPIGAQPDFKPGLGDTGGASRFYPVFRYQAKAPASERPRLEDGTAHETVKPLGLISWLVRLVTPPGGTVLDMFAGSGPVAEACIVEGFRCVLVEQDAKSAALIRKRLSKPIQPVMFGLG